MSDRLLLYSAATLRPVAAATTSVSVGAYLKTLGHGATILGYVTSAGLAGPARGGRGLEDHIRRSPVALVPSACAARRAGEAVMVDPTLVAQALLTTRRTRARFLYRMFPVCPSE